MVAWGGQGWVRGREGLCQEGFQRGLTKVLEGMDVLINIIMEMVYRTFRQQNLDCTS